MYNDVYHQEINLESDFDDVSFMNDSQFAAGRMLADVSVDTPHDDQNSFSHIYSVNSIILINYFQKKFVLTISIIAKVKTHTGGGCAASKPFML